jgi:hypothetical protein
MSVLAALNKIAYFQNRRDEAPNQVLARQLVDAHDREGVGELAENLWNKNSNIRNDCIKTLYEVGYLAPELILLVSEQPSLPSKSYGDMAQRKPTS